MLATDLLFSKNCLAQSTLEVSKKDKLVPVVLYSSLINHGSFIETLGWWRKINLELISCCQQIAAGLVTLVDHGS